MKDTQYSNRDYLLPQSPHRYGDRFHLIQDANLFSILAKLGSPECVQPMVNHYLEILYGGLLRYAVNAEFPRTTTKITTRMKALHPEGEFEATIVDPQTQAVCVNLARAGTVPSQICYHALTYLLDPSKVRQDHISINRKTNTDEQVIGTHLGGTKIGGDIGGRMVLIPDPMGATGSTLQSTVDLYKGRGESRAILALHLIVTPEYLKTVLPLSPKLKVFALRLDRGLSTQEVLNTEPGTYWEKERGLNSKQYIVPGAGGLGEVINNAYV